MPRDGAGEEDEVAPPLLNRRRRTERASPEQTSPRTGAEDAEMRAIWSGHITFGLISIPVGVYSAVETSERVSFRMLHRKDHAPIKYKKFCSKEDVEVPNDEIVKGYEVSKNKFALV